MNPPNFIRIPMFMLHHVKNVWEFSGLTKAEWEQAAMEYSKEELLGVTDAIRWAVRNKNYDFRSLLPDIDFENEEIHYFFCKLEESMPNKGSD